MLLGKFILNNVRADSQQNRKVIQTSMTKTTSNTLLFRRLYLVIIIKQIRRNYISHPFVFVVTTYCVKLVICFFVIGILRMDYSIDHDVCQYGTQWNLSVVCNGQGGWAWLRREIDRIDRDDIRSCLCCVSVFHFFGIHETFRIAQNDARVEFAVRVTRNLPPTFLMDFQYDDCIAVHGRDEWYHVLIF